jgi:hypothetical protein
MYLGYGCFFVNAAPLSVDKICSGGGRFLRVRVGACSMFDFLKEKLHLCSVTLTEKNYGTTD